MSIDIVNVHQMYQDEGYLGMIIGPMFAGKTSHLIQTYNKCKRANIPVQVVNFIGDNRYHDTHLCSHDNVQIDCIQLDELSKLMTYSILPESVVLINEGQFFPDCLESIKYMVDELKLKVIVYGLDGDFKRKPFGKFLDLIPIATDLMKIKSQCYYCGYKNDALFSHRITDEIEQCVIGTSNYKPCCRKCYLKKA
jgi:thymidine kinase|uniref:thymidine kinase n=1 Tax=viral metagenome TaxID=1070528 RepID=A0A6C0JCQ6_9ZZZZ